ncbi:hypothetical protein ACFXPA_17650 [Amycolatopsis sp. NPDC059090]|uniref:hypothetical protein n=1 Tax=Amycolatopsis sp. NPDC059090 TaxID=3346723 RepID=UPI003672F8E1
MEGKYRYPPMERPLGSGIWGRPTLADNLKHFAYYIDRDDLWKTWCGQEVPPDHKCPPIGWRPDGTRGAVRTCQDCERRYKEQHNFAAAVSRKFPHRGSSGSGSHA